MAPLPRSAPLKLRLSAGSRCSHGDQPPHGWKSLSTPEILSPGAVMEARRSMRKVSDLVAARIRTTAIASASTMATMIRIPDMAGSVSANFAARNSAAERQQRTQGCVAQPHPAPQHQAEVKPEQRMREQGAVD